MLMLQFARKTKGEPVVLSFQITRTTKIIIKKFGFKSLRVAMKPIYHSETSIGKLAMTIFKITFLEIISPHWERAWLNDDE